MNPLLKVHNLDVGYDQILIHNLNFELMAGDRLIVYGSNGTGKSTLLQTLIKPQVSQKPFVKWSLNPDEILLIHQQPSFHSQTPDDVKSYLMNVLMYKKPFQKPDLNDHDKIESVLKKLHLNNVPLKNLSGGQRQKLKIARGLLHETKVLLLDEPFNAIDQTSSSEIIHWLNESRKTTAQIIVLHDFEQIEKLKSEVLWIQADGWKILGFEKWFDLVDKQFHSWIHQVHKIKNSPVNNPEVLI